MILLSFSACKNQKENQQATTLPKDPRQSDEGMRVAYQLQEKIKVSIPVNHQTAPVNAPADMDSADDPAIWINHQNPSESLIIGTHKKKGLYVFNLQGEILGNTRLEKSIMLTSDRKW